MFFIYLCTQITLYEKIMKKPFVFGVAVEEENFVGRSEEITVLSNNFKYGVNTILLAPRRMGKTSLVKRVAKDVQSDEIRIVHLDIFSCRNEYDFLNMFASAVLKQTSSHFEELMQDARDFLSRIVPKVNFSPDPTQDYSLSLGITPRTHQPEDVLNLPEQIARKKGIHIIVCIDEFQQVGEFPDSLYVQKRMRSVWQHQGNVSYCLYGSKKNMMITLFQQRSKPFYKFGATMELGTIPAKDWIPYLRRQFEAEGRELSESLAEKICNKVELHSSYVQQLAFNVLVCTPASGTATDDGLAQAYENLLDENTTLFQDKTENLTGYQLNFLKAVLSGIHDDFGKADVREEYNLGSHSNIVRIKTALVEKELIEIRKEGIFIADPVMSQWLRCRFCWA